MERCDSDSWAVGAMLFKIEDGKQEIKWLLKRPEETNRCLNRLFKGAELLTDRESEGGDVTYLKRKKKLHH